MCQYEWYYERNYVKNPHKHRYPNVGSISDKTFSTTSKEIAGKLPMVKSLLRKSLVSLKENRSL